MTAADRYLDAVRDVLTHLQATQREAVDKAADLVSGAWKGGGAVFCTDVGHGNEKDFLDRAGGLAGLHYFGFEFNVTSRVASCLESARTQPAEEALGLNIRHALKTGRVRAGDVLLTSSVSGASARPVELALACREFGILVIGMSAFQYADRSPHQHSSGKKLHEVVDVALDIGAPFGDAAVEIPGYPFPVLPVSGVAMTVAGWLIWARVMEKTAEAGEPATVFMSINREGGREAYKLSVEEYSRRGF
jgi:uncharacterized phosphosugar-binding protein